MAKYFPRAGALVTWTDEDEEGNVKVEVGKVVTWTKHKETGSWLYTMDMGEGNEPRFMIALQEQLSPFNPKAVQ